MRFYLACYDAGADAVAGSFWTWHHPEIGADALDKSYYEVASKNLPLPSTNSFHILATPNGLWGGCAGISPEWACWYRFADGGTDVRGRPGRSVLFAAFFRPDDGRGNDTSGVLCSDFFQENGRLARLRRPVPCPTRLELSIPLGPAHRDPSQWERLRRESRMEFNEPNAITAAGNLIANIPPGTCFDCRVQREAGSESAVLNVLSSLEPTTERSVILGGMAGDIKPACSQVFTSANRKPTVRKTMLQTMGLGPRNRQYGLATALFIFIMGFGLGFWYKSLLVKRAKPGTSKALAHKNTSKGSKHSESGVWVPAISPASRPAISGTPVPSTTVSQRPPSTRGFGGPSKLEKLGSK